MRPDFKGFTLIEVVIALALLSLMVVLLFSSLAISADSWNKGEDKITEANENGVVYSFFRNYLAASKPLLLDFDVNTASRLAFQGGEQAVQFVASLPASAAKAGPQLMTVALVEEEDERMIKVTMTPFYPAADNEQWQPEEAVLMRHVDEFSLAYFGPDENTGEAGWQSEWREKQTQPALVKITLTSEKNAYIAPIVVALKAVGGDINTEQALQDRQSQSQNRQDPFQDRQAEPLQ